MEARSEPGALLVRVPRKVRVPPSASMMALFVVDDPMEPLPWTVAELVSDPPESEAVPSREALSGRGTTYFLVCDESKPQPVWVAKHDIEKHSVG